MVWFGPSWQQRMTLSLCRRFPHWGGEENGKKRPGKVDSCFLPSPKQLYQKPTGILLGPWNTLSWDSLYQGCTGPWGQSRWGAFATHSQLGSLQPPVQSAFGIPLSLQKYRWTLTLWNLMALKYTVHQCPLELSTLVDLTCQATESTPTNKSGCPFPPPGWRQGTSNPGQRICCSPAVKMTWRSPPEDWNQNQTVYLVWRADCWKLEWHFS